jgi:hypothetical protein
MVEIKCYAVHPAGNADWKYADEITEKVIRNTQAPNRS